MPSISAEGCFEECWWLWVVPGGAELENTGRLFSVSINTRGVAKVLVVSLKTHCAVGSFGVFQLGMEGLFGLLSPFAGLCSSFDDFSGQSAKIKAAAKNDWGKLGGLKLYLGLSPVGWPCWPCVGTGHSS